MKEHITRAVRWAVAVALAFLVSLPVYVSYASANEMENPGCKRTVVCRDLTTGDHYFLGSSSVGFLTKVRTADRGKSVPVAVMVLDTAGKKHVFAAGDVAKDPCESYCVSGPF